MFIHFVIFVAQLEFLFIDVDFYQRLKFDDENFSSIIMKNNDSTFYYEIERLFNRRISNDKIQYFIKWKKYESTYNVWYNNDNFVDVQNLIDDYEKFVVDWLRLLTRARRIKMFFDSNDILIFKKFDKNTWETRKIFAIIKTSFFFYDDKCYEFDIYVKNETIIVE